MAKKGPLYPHIPKSQRGMGIVVTTLFWSINEEEQAVRDYTERAAGARQSGDEETARLFEHIATEEETHAKEFKERMHTLMEGTKGFIKEFELVPGDRVRLTMPASEPFPAGWAEGKVLTAKHYGERDGWYIELEKDKVSPGWQKGYGYWKQGVDRGTVEKL